MTADPAGWPDPARPGVPLNPERDGWHWVAWDPTWPEPAFWDAANREWSQSEVSNINTQHAAYLGPCLTPAEVAAREQAAYQQGWGDREDDFIAGTERSGLIVIAPNDLAAREREAEAAGFLRGMERAAQDTDCGCTARADVLARLATDGHKRASYLCPHGDVCCALQAAAIREAAKEKK